MKEDHTSRFGAVLVLVALALCCSIDASAQSQILVRGGSAKSIEDIATTNASMNVQKLKDITDSTSTVFSVPAGLQQEWLERLRVLQKANGDSFTATPLKGDYRALFHPLQQTGDLSVIQEKALNAIRRTAPENTSVVSLTPRPLARAALTVGFDTRDGFTQPGSLSITVEPGKTINLTKDEASPVEGGYVWRGRPEATAGATAPVGSAVLVTRGDSITGTVRINNDTYSISPLGNGVHAISKRATKPPEHPPRFNEKKQESPTKDAPPAASAPIGLSDAVTIDIYVAFSKQASDEVLDELGLVTLAIDDTNTSFIDSGIPALRVRSVGWTKFAYSEAPKWDTHLDRLMDKKDKLFRELHKIRDETKADVVVLMVSDLGACGEAGAINAVPETAFIVLSQSCVKDNYSFAHELGHILGARHNILRDGQLTPDRWAHGYVNGKKWRTVMAYDDCDGCRRILRWSNPNIPYESEPTGTESLEFDARTWLEHGKRVASFR